MSAMRFIGLQVEVTSTTREKIGQSWKDFVPVMSDIPNPVNPFPYGVVSGGPDLLLYMPALQTQLDAESPSHLSTVDVPAATYLVFTHTGSTELFPQSMDYIFNKWWSKNSYEHTHTPELEIYDERFDPETNSGEIDICIPIKLD